MRQAVHLVIDRQLVEGWVRIGVTDQGPGVPEEWRERIFEPYARRVTHTARGSGIGLYAAKLLDSPLPWTRMRQVYALLGLVRRFGVEAVEKACTTALAVDLLSIKRLQRLIELAAPPRPPELPANVIPISRYLRPPEQYALPGLDRNSTHDEQDKE